MMGNIASTFNKGWLCLKWGASCLWGFVHHRKEMPIWLILGIAVATWFGTNYLAPEIHQKFEAQRVKSELTIERLNGLNDITRELFKNITIHNQHISRGEPIPESLSETINMQFTELSWRTVETRAVLKSEESQKILDDYRNALDAMRKSFTLTDDVESALLLLDRTEQFANESIALSDELLRVSLD